MLPFKDRRVVGSSIMAQHLRSSKYLNFSTNGARPSKVKIAAFQKSLSHVRGRMMKYLGTFGIRAPRRTLVLVVSFAIAAVIFGASTPGRLSNSETEFLSHGTESYKGTELLQASFGKRPFPDVGVIYSIGGEKRSARVLEIVQQTVHLIPQSFVSRDERSIALVGSFERGIDSGAAAVRLAKRFRFFTGVAVGGTALA